MSRTHSGPAGDVTRRRRPEGSEVALREARGPAPPSRRPGRSSPRRRRAGRRVAAPRSRTEEHGRGRATVRRIPCQQLDLVRRARAVREQPPQASRPALHRRSIDRALLDPQPPFTARSTDSQREGPVVASRDEMDRRAHQRFLHDRPALERPIEIGSGERLHPRPEPDVHRGVRTAPEGRPSARGRGGSGGHERSSRSCRASSARFSSRCVSVRSDTRTYLRTC